MKKMTENYKKYSLIVAVVVTFVILVIIKLSVAGGFKADAKKWLMPSVAGENIISGNKLADLKGEKLVLIIGRYTPLTDSDHITILNLPPKQLLDKKYIRLIRHHRGPVLLCSSDISMISRLWMILSQMGCSNLYILTNNSDNETLRYSFQPDSSSFVKI